jgi:hypothetical protein
MVLVLVGTMVMASPTQPDPATTTTPPPPSTTTAAISTTTALPTTTTTEATTTTSQPTTTTKPPETVPKFVDRYRIALEEDDVDFLLRRLHPKVIEAYGQERCRNWVENEIVVLANYQLAGKVSGPVDQQFTDPEGVPFAIADVFTAPVSFTFEGADFEAEAQFALVDGRIYWLGSCR